MNNLETLLHQYESNGRIHHFKDKEWQAAFTLLFRLAADEREVYVSSTKHKSAAESRLAACGKVLRILTEFSVRKFRIKTAQAILDHVCENASTPSGSLCEPLFNDYIKSMRCILEYQPHVEHLRDAWSSTVSFCVEVLQHVLNNEQGQSFQATASTARSTSRSKLNSSFEQSKR